MAAVVENEERLFEHYFDLSPKLRMMVIDEMEAIDRCRLTRCSKLCNEEAKASKKYLFGLFLQFVSENRITIKVIHGELITRQEYNIDFIKDSNTKQKICSSATWRTLWEDDLDRLTSLLRRAITEFKTILRTYRKTIKWLYIQGPYLRENIGLMRNITYGIESLDNLEELAVCGDVDVIKIFSKLRKPLKFLNLDAVKNHARIMNCKQVYEVRNHLNWFNASVFNNDQFIKLSAKIVFIHIGKLTERDVYKFIRSWQNGSIGKVIKNYKWHLYRSTFNEQKLLRLLRVKGDETRSIEIKHFLIPGKSALLEFSNGILKFLTDLEDDH